MNHTLNIYSRESMRIDCIGKVVLVLVVIALSSVTRTIQVRSFVFLFSFLFNPRKTKTTSSFVSPSHIKCTQIVDE